MNNSEVQSNSIASMVDFTLLDPRATEVDIEKVCDIAYKNQYYSVCINPCNVQIAKKYIEKHFPGSLKVVTVIGFPLGANCTETKIEEARRALADGADELDVVINIGRAKSLDYEYVSSELSLIKKLAHEHIVKAILETCYFNANEIIKLCQCCTKAGVDFVKTSTGFGTAGADEEIVKIMVNETRGKCLVKASGGIRTTEKARLFVELGVSRIGTSSVI